MGDGTANQELSAESEYRARLQRTATTTVWIYSGLIMVLLPAFHYILKAVPGTPPDSMPIRLAAAAVSAVISLGLLFWPPLRRHAETLQLVNILFVLLDIIVLVVNSGNEYMYVASGLLGVVGAQQAFYRPRDLALTFIAGFFFQAWYSFERGILFNPLGLTALAIYGTAYIIGFIPSVVRMRIQEREMRSEIELRRSRERLQQVNAMTELGQWSHEFATGLVEWSEEVYRMFGMVPGSGTSLKGVYEGSIHPEDRKAVEAALAQAERSGTTYTIDHRIVWRDGSIRWLHVRGKYEYDDGGRPARRLGAVLDITSRMEAEENLRRMARFDALTGLPNRNVLHEQLRTLLAGAEPACAVLFVDLDLFKDINDTLGHAMGDELLQQVAERLRAALSPEAVLARWGGDEFVVVLPGIRARSEAAGLAERLICTIAEPFEIDGYDLTITASVGITMCPQDGAEATLLIRNADTAMYRAKERARRTYTFFSPSMHATAAARHRIQNELHRAVVNGELVLHYQPIFDASTGNLAAAEALIRWNAADGRLRPPSEFIGIAEETGEIVTVGAWTLEEVCRRIAGWQDSGLAVPICANVSARQLGHSGFFEVLGEALLRTGIDPSLLEIEITESALLSNDDAVLTLLREIKQLGVRLILDDFGTGYSAFAYLKRFPLDSMKLDRTFVNGIDRESDRAIAASIINIAHTLGLSVTGEGVETAAQMQILRELGCNRLQGFYFSRPLPVHAFEDLYLRHARASA